MRPAEGKPTDSASFSPAKTKRGASAAGWAAAPRRAPAKVSGGKGTDAARSLPQGGDAGEELTTGRE